MSQNSSAHRSLRRTGIGILVVGLVVAISVFIADLRATTEAASGANYTGKLADDQREQAAVERLGGKATVMTVEFHQWWTSWWQGRRLAYTIAALSLLAAWLCWHLAELAEDDAPT